MLNTNSTQIALTPEQVAIALQLSKNTVYQLISSGEIVAKKYGRTYRISPKSLSYLYTGLDQDLSLAEQKDLMNLTAVSKAIDETRGISK